MIGRFERTLAPLAFVVAALLSGCGSSTAEHARGDDSSTATRPTPPPAHADNRPVDTRPPPMAQPIPLWQNGHSVKQVDAATASLHGQLVLDLGEEWVPYIFTERDSAQDEPKPNVYRKTYLELARGKFPDGWQGDRARKDKYLELYGIMPTLDLMRTRYEQVKQLACVAHEDLQPLKDFDGIVTYQGNDTARRDLRRYQALERAVQRIMHHQHVDDPAQIDTSVLHHARDVRAVRDYIRLAPRHAAIVATQERLQCEGYFAGKGHYTHGAFDWATQEALHEFEGRHRIYSWGYIGNDTLAALRKPALELEREGVVRVLTERAMHAEGVIEDGSTSTKYDGSPRTFLGRDGKQHPIPNMEAKLQQTIVSSFGLQTPESALAWLEHIGELPKDQPHLVAVPAPPLPEYYDGDMDLSVVIDRGDVWYAFPYDNQGHERPQPVSHRPHLTLFVKYLGHEIPLCRYGTTIGGWHHEFVDGTVMWKYKNSPVGPRVWHQIIAAPVWLPPDSTPPKDLLRRNPRRRQRGQPDYLVKYNETGPSYASAYGLVAAYHLKFSVRSDGTIRYGGDEGIRTHGSVDYMSIMHRHSHGCHRLHNHLAVRLMSFVLAHRPHERLGEQHVGYRRDIQYKDKTYHIAIDQGGYVFQLDQPVHVNVLEGRIRGAVHDPIEDAIPQFDVDAGVYVLPDGGAVSVTPTGQMTAIPFPDGGMTDGAMDGGVPMAAATAAPAATTAPAAPMPTPAP